jgi:hypothetical protein
MSFFDKVKDAAMNQFIEVIEWLDNSGTRFFIVFRFTDRKSKTARS